MLPILALVASSFVAPVPAPAFSPPTNAAELQAMVSLLGAPPAAVDPCYVALQDALQAADQWEADCLSAPVPGPTPCMDWPECCSTEAATQRAWAWWNYWTCLGINPGPPPNSAPVLLVMADPCGDARDAALQMVEQDFIFCVGEGPGQDPVDPVIREWCELERLRQIDLVNCRYRECMGWGICDETQYPPIPEPTSAH